MKRREFSIIRTPIPCQEDFRKNAFGILAWRFGVLKRIELKPDTIDRVILAACSLHNWLRKTSPGHYMPQKHWTEKILTQESNTWSVEVTCQHLTTSDLTGQQQSKQNSNTDQTTVHEIFH
ncbi:hypothetical protein TNCV_115121 [Trichonephila clavipes]|nr:hypothetical protein TNCV_115121 [Trichonephila clavipes]